ncbi:MAG: hypothetical protein ACLS4Z_01970 [Christensenellaceae bacterium]
MQKSADRRADAILVLGEGHQGFGRGKAFPDAKVSVRPFNPIRKRVRG